MIAHCVHMSAVIEVRTKPTIDTMHNQREHIAHMESMARVRGR